MHRADISSLGLEYAHGRQLTLACFKRMHTSAKPGVRR